MTARPHAFGGAYLTGEVCEGCFIGFTSGGPCAFCVNVSGPALRHNWAMLDGAAFLFVVREGGEARRPRDITGATYGRWVVLEIHSSGHDKQTKWTCLCACGRRQVVHGFSLLNGTSTQCKRCALQRLRVDHIGERIGERVCIARGRGSKWTWRCDCGAVANLALADVRRRRCRHPPAQPSASRDAPKEKT